VSQVTGMARRRVAGGDEDVARGGDQKSKWVRFFI
jgi:hypothetical protein